MAPPRLIQCQFVAWQAAVVLAAILLVSQSPVNAAPPAFPGIEPGTLSDARKSHRTTLREKVSAKDVPTAPPKGVFDLIRYKSPAGEFAAYLTPDPRDAVKRPAIIWITGGTCNTIGDVWSESPPENDQTASAYRKAGIVMMFPSLRGGNEGRGVQEGFYGEVDDVIAAADHLAKLPYVDPARIYLGGHSTGGTLALLVAECSNRFRAVFAFGPATGVLGYRGGGIKLPFDLSNGKELKLRSPMFWLDSIQSPTYIFEGLKAPGNADDLETLNRWRGTPTVVRCVGVKGVDHFSILAPANKVLAAKILKDTGAKPALDLTREELNAISPGAGDALPPAAGPAPRQPPAPAVPPGRFQPGGGIESTPLVGKKGDQTSQTAVSRTDQLTGLAFTMNDSGTIRSVTHLSLKSRPPAEQPNLKRVSGRDGYVLYGARVDAADHVNAMQLVFVRLNNDGNIVPTDTYESDWIGTPTNQAKAQTLGCNGKRMVGFIKSTQGDRLSGFALSMTQSASPPTEVQPKR